MARSWSCIIVTWWLSSYVCKYLTVSYIADHELRRFILFLIMKGTLNAIPMWKALKWRISSICSTNLGTPSDIYNDWIETAPLVSYKVVRQQNERPLFDTRSLMSLIDAWSDFLYSSNSSGCVDRITNEARFVGRRIAGGFGIQLGGMLVCNTDGVSRGLILPFLDMVGYEDGQCCSHITASLEDTIFLKGIAVNHASRSSLSAGNLNTGTFFLLNSAPLLLW